MATKVLMPQLGESVTEGTISRWLKREGEAIAKDELLVEIITDKVTAEMPSPFAGTLLKIVAPEGTAVEVGQEIAHIQEVGTRPDPRAKVQGESPPVAQTAIASAVSVPIVETAAVARSGVATSGRRSTPMVRRLARENGIDLDAVVGMGINGRITKDDIRNYLAQSSAPVAFTPERRTAPPTDLAVPHDGAAPSSQETPISPSESSVLPQDGQWVELTPMRRAIADHMVRSKQTSPHALTVIEVDMSTIVKWRESIKSEFKRREGIDLTFLPFVMKATVEALKANPTINASWLSDRILLKKEINLGVAVSIDDGLVVPVVHKADEKSIAGLAKAVAEIVTRARSGRLALPDIQGGTFTINNTGSYGSIISVPIINQPQAAILSMEAIQKRPVVVDDAIAIRSMMYLCLSFDHRIIDGAVAGRFLRHIRTWLDGFGPTTPLY